MANPRDNDELFSSDRDILALFRALTASLTYIECGSEPEKAILLTEEALALRKTPRDAVNVAIDMAMYRIVGKNPPKRKARRVPAAPWTEHVAGKVALAWLDWVEGDLVSAERKIDQIRRNQKGQEEGDKTSAVSLFALHLCTEAIHNLTQNDLKSARPFFQRAAELGSQYGTDSHIMISWIYVSTLWPSKEESERIGPGGLPPKPPRALWINEEGLPLLLGKRSPQIC